MRKIVRYCFLKNKNYFMNGVVILNEKLFINFLCISNWFLVENKNVQFLLHFLLIKSKFYESYYNIVCLVSKHIIKKTFPVDRINWSICFVLIDTKTIYNIIKKYQPKIWCQSVYIAGNLRPYHFLILCFSKLSTQ